MSPVGKNSYKTDGGGFGWKENREVGVEEEESSPPPSPGFTTALVATGTNPERAISMDKVTIQDEGVIV